MLLRRNEQGRGSCLYRARIWREGQGCIGKNRRQQNKNHDRKRLVATTPAGADPAKERVMKGFKQWYVRMVKPEYANRSYRELKEIFGSEYRNTGNIELPGRMTKTGSPAIW